MATPRASAPQPSVLVLIGLVITGALVGWAGSWASVHGVQQWLYDVISYGAVYVVALAGISVPAPSAASAARRAGAFFIPFVLAYYGYAALTFGGVPLAYASSWALAAVVAVFASAGLNLAARRLPRLMSVLAAVLAATALADGTAVNLLLGRYLPWSAHWVQAAFSAAVATAVALYLPRTARGRAAAAVLAVPLTAIALAVGSALHYGPPAFG